ncbi:hypothetical protein PSTT_04686, partial [Puccinia striiformis]
GRLRGKESAKMSPINSERKTVRVKYQVEENQDFQLSEEFKAELGEKISILKGYDKIEIELEFIDRKKTVIRIDSNRLEKILSKIYVQVEELKTKRNELSTRSESSMFSMNQDERFRTLALGGTFDHLHSGHKILLTIASWIATHRLIIGITDDQLLKNKQHSNQLQSLEERQEAVRKFLDRVGPKNIIIETPRLVDVYGPTATDPDIDALLVSQETLPGAQSIDNIRKSNGLNPLKVFVIDVISPHLTHIPQDLTLKISSTHIRAWLNSPDKSLNEYLYPSVPSTHQVELGMKVKTRREGPAIMPGIELDSLSDELSYLTSSINLDLSETQSQPQSQSQTNPVVKDSTSDDLIPSDDPCYHNLKLPSSCLFSMVIKWYIINLLPLRIHSLSMIILASIIRSVQNNRESFARQSRAEAQLSSDNTLRERVKFKFNKPNVEWSCQYDNPDDHQDVDDQDQSSSPSINPLSERLNEKFVSKIVQEKLETLITNDYVDYVHEISSSNINNNNNIISLIINQIILLVYWIVRSLISFSALVYSWNKLFNLILSSTITSSSSSSSSSDLP